MTRANRGTQHVERQRQMLRSFSRRRRPRSASRQGSGRASRAPRGSTRWLMCRSLVASRRMRAGLQGYEATRPQGAPAFSTVLRISLSPWRAGWEFSNRSWGKSVGEHSFTISARWQSRMRYYKNQIPCLPRRRQSCKPTRKKPSKSFPRSTIYSRPLIFPTVTMRSGMERAIPGG